MLLIAYTPPAAHGAYTERGAGIQPRSAFQRSPPYRCRPPLSHRQQVMHAYDRDGWIV
jgi:hypothetical protein